MKAFLLALTAVFLLGFSTNSVAQSNEIKAANGRFYCNGTFNFDLRMDVDFFGNGADAQIYNIHSGVGGREFGNFDQFRSDAFNSYYELSNGAVLQFPADYERQHWFELTYSDMNGWIHFDCNHF